MRNKEYDYLVSIVYDGKKESMILKAKNKKEAKYKVYDLVMRSNIWNYKKDEFELECERIKIFKGGNYEIIKFNRKKNKWL